MSNSFSNQVPAHLDLWKNRESHKIGVYVLSKQLDGEVARLHLQKDGRQADEAVREASRVSSVRRLGDRTTAGGIEGPSELR
jgi:S-adenosylhomocysteine hydrolase